jgi:membrane protein implicated in regulation of membrane protease activity
MRLYTVHIRRTSRDADREAVLVREGFSWGAFLFTVLWVLWRGLWLAAIMIVLAALVIGAVVELAGLDPVVEAVLSLAFALYIGFAGNDWRRRRLARRGYEEAAIIAAGDVTEAERRYFDRAGPDAAVPA